VGKTKLIAVSPYDITLVVRMRTPNKDVSGEAATELGPLILVDTGDIPAVVLVWMPMYPSELDGDTEVVVLEVNEALERLDKVMLTLDDVDDCEVDDEELLNRLLEDVVEFHGGTRVVKTVDGPGFGSPVVGPLGELTDRTEVSVRVLVVTWFDELVDDGDGVTLLVEEVLEDGSGLELLEDCVDDDDALELLGGWLVELEVWDEELVDDSLDEVPETLEPEEDEVEDEGQEKTLELGAKDVVLEADADEEDIPELPPLVTDKREDAEKDTDVVERTIWVMVIPDVIRVTVLVITEGELVVVTLPGLEDGFGNEIVRPSLIEREDIDERLLEDWEGDGDVDAGDVTLIIAVEIMTTVVVCSPGSVLVSVLKKLEVIDGAGLGGASDDDGVITVTDVLVNTIVDPPDIVLVIVIKVPDVEGEAVLGDGLTDEGLMVTTTVLVIKAVELPDVPLVMVARLVDTVGDIELGGLMDGDAPMTVVKVLVHVVVCPPGMVLVSVLKKLDVIGEDDTLIGADGKPPTTVVVIIVKVVNDPPEAVLVAVMVTLEAISEEVLDRALVGSVEGPADVNDGVDTTTLLVKPGVLVGWLGLWLGGRSPGVDTVFCGSERILLDEAAQDEVIGTEDMINVISGVTVDSVLNRLGGVMLFIHSVVPLMTEK
jgi:hypothetical protein